LDYSLTSVQSLEAWIQDQVDTRKTKHDPQSLISAMGCYVGEVIVRNIGGHWTTIDNRAAIVDIGKITVASPLQKVTKRLTNGPSDGLYGYVQLIKKMASNGKKGV